MPKRPLIDVTQLDKQEKINLLKDLLDNMEVVITGCYGSHADLISTDIREAHPDDLEFLNCSTDAVIIGTDLCSG